MKDPDSVPFYISGIGRTNALNDPNQYQVEPVPARKPQQAESFVDIDLSVLEREEEVQG